MKSRFYAFAMAVSLFAFFISGFMICRYYYNAGQSAKNFEGVKELIVQNNTKSNTKTSQPSESTVEPVITSAEKYSKVYEKNKDFVGWIFIEDTNVNYPVVQKKDVKDYYLKRSFEKEYSSFGTPYVDEECDISASDNLVIYGHHMKNGSMFSDICDYKRKSFWEEHKIINFDTLYGYGTYEVLAAFKISETAQNKFKYFNFINAANEKKFDEFISECKKRSFYDTGVPAKYGDKLITLSTCEYSVENGRMVVVAKKIESETNSVS